MEKTRSSFLSLFASTVLTLGATSHNRFQIFIGILHTPSIWQLVTKTQKMATENKSVVKGM